METVVPPPPEAELHLLTEWGDPAERGRTRTAAVVSVVVHAAAISLILLLPASFLAPPPIPETHRIITPLVEPLTTLTQKAPNVGKLSKEFSAAVTPKPRIQMATPPPAAPRPAPPKPLAIPSPPPKAATPAQQPEPPKVEASAKPTPKVDLS